MCTRTMTIALVATGLVLSAFAQNVKVDKVPARYTSPASAQEMYVNYCAACHGADLKGNGPAAPALKTPPTDLTTLSARHRGKFPADVVYSVLMGKTDLAAHGSAEMPVWGKVFRQLDAGHGSQVQLRATNLTAYIESKQAK